MFSFDVGQSRTAHFAIIVTLYPVRGNPFLSDSKQVAR
jgi:hypothetical protein